MTVTTKTVSSGYSTGTINENFQTLEDYINNNLLNRDGASPGEPNQMEVALDMNSNPILNAETDPNDPDSLLTVSGGDLRYVNVTGDTMSGSLDMAFNSLDNLPEPTIENQAARLQDVQNALAGGAANLITFSSYGNTSSGNVQGAIQELVDGTGQAITTSTGADQTLVEALGQRVIYVNTIADLQALDSSGLVDGQAIRVTSTGRGGSFVVQLGDFSSEVTGDPESGIWVPFNSDPTGSTIVAMRSYYGAVNAQWFGAGSDKTISENSTAINAAISFASQQLVGVEIPQDDDYYEVNSIALDGDSIVLDSRFAYLRNTGTDPMFIIGENSNLTFAQIHIGRILSSSTSGVDFDVRGLMAQCSLYVHRLTHGNPSTPIIDCSGASSSLFFNTFDGHQWNMAADSTVPAINVEGATNICSANRFVFNRADRCGTQPFFKFNCTGSGQFFYNNKIECDWEVVNGGAVHLLGCSQTNISNGNFFDMGTTTKNLILLSSSSGNPCRNTIISNISRNSGTLGPGLYDINVDDAENTLIINSGAHNPSVGVNYLISGQDVTLINVNNASLSGALTSTQEVNSSGVRKVAPTSSQTKVIASSSITATQSYHRIDTEGGASTDTLSTIGGGRPGMELTLQSTSNSRDITIANGTGNIRLNGGANRVLDRVTDAIKLVYTDVTNEWCEVSFSDNQA